MGGGALAALYASCSPDSGPDEPGSEVRTPGSGPDAPVRDLDGPLHYASLLAVARLIEQGDMSAVELTELALRRIEAVEGRLRAYATLMAEQALEAARAAEEEIRSGTYRGPLHGIPVGVKDLCYTKGVPTRGGLGVRADFVPEFDGTAVSRLKEAGAILLGKLNLTEGAMGGYHPDFEVPVNPWDPDLWTGASSSGSGVATAAGLCFASLGTDTGGSIRFPAMANGTVGLKPTYGRVSRYGVLPLAESMDHVGPLTRRVADAAVVLQTIAGYDPADPTSLRAPVPDMLADLDRGVEGMRIGFDRRYAMEGIDPGLNDAIEVALGELEALGARIVPVEMPSSEETLRDVWFTICSYEAHAAHGSTYPSRKEEYGPYFRDFLDLGSAVTEADYVKARRVREDYSDRLRAVLGRVDAVAVPAGGAPFPISEEVQRGDMAGFGSVMPNVHMRFTIPADFAGTPTLSLPCGVSAAGPPYTIQFMGPALSEPLLCRLGHAYERMTTWHTLHPPV